MNAKWVSIFSLVAVGLTALVFQACGDSTVSPPLTPVPPPGSSDGGNGDAGTALKPCFDGSPTRQEDFLNRCTSVGGGVELKLDFTKAGREDL